MISVSNKIIETRVLSILTNGEPATPQLLEMYAETALVKNHGVVMYGDKPMHIGAVAQLADHSIVGLPIGGEPAIIRNLNIDEGAVRATDATLPVMWNRSKRYQIGELNYKMLMEEYNSNASEKQQIVGLIAATGDVVR